MLDKTRAEMTDDNHLDFSGLTALTINCTLKKTPEASHTDKLLGIPETILVNNGIALERVRLADHEIAPGMQTDMVDHGAERDDWPFIWNKVDAADILIIGTPIWLGQNSSVCQRLIERLYAHSGETNDMGQYAFYGKTGGVIVTGNEDGIKHVGMGVLYSLQHMGYTIPPQADAGWVGEAGPGPSYGDAKEDGHGYVGFDNDFTRRNATFMTWNLMHMARMLRDSGGFPSHGNSVDLWDEGQRFDAPHPEYS